MRILIFLLAFAAALLNAPRVAGAGEAVPKFDITRNCRAETADSSGIGETLASCVKAEEQAKKEIADQWSHFDGKDKLICIRETSLDGTPSYVELETCLEMATDNKVRIKSKR